MESLKHDVCIRQCCYRFSVFFFHRDFFRLFIEPLYWKSKIDAMSYAIGVRNAFNNKQQRKEKKKTVPIQWHKWILWKKWMAHCKWLHSHFVYLFPSYAFTQSFISSHFAHWCYSFMKFNDLITSETIQWSISHFHSHQPIFVEPTF